jgi:DNA-binding MarR family transcriptional regulator
MSNFNKLTATQRKVIDTLTDGPKSIKDIARIAEVSTGSVYRPVRDLVGAGWIEEDRDNSAFSREKYFKIKRSPNSGIELIVNVGNEQQAVSFNLFLETIAKAAEVQSVPKIAKSWPTLQRAIAYLAIYAAQELKVPGSVSEENLLEVRASLNRYMDVLKEQTTLVGQILLNDDFWEAKTLKTGTMTKTDRYFTAEQMQDFARIILAQFKRSSDDEINADEILEGEVVR